MHCGDTVLKINKLNSQSHFIVSLHFVADGNGAV